MLYYGRGLKKGLKEGMFGSGLLLGTVLPFGITIAFLIGLVVALVRCFDSGPGRCTNYSYSVGYLGPDTMTCTQWPAMEMRIEKRMIRSSIVHCSCTAASHAATTPP